MNLNDLLNARRLKNHKAAKQEIDQLFRVVERDIKDAQVPGLSADRRFATAYNAVLQLGSIVLAVKGYRTAGVGHHATIFLGLKSILDKNHESTLDYFNACRDKRNLADYGVSGIVSEKEALELIEEAKKFSAFVHQWIKGRV